MRMRTVKEFKKKRFEIRCASILILRRKRIFPLSLSTNKELNRKKKSSFVCTITSNAFLSNAAFILIRSIL